MAQKFLLNVFGVLILAAFSVMVWLRAAPPAAEAAYPDDAVIIQSLPAR